MHLGVYTDYAYHRDGEAVYGERAFALFLGALHDHVDRLLLVGRLRPAREPGRYPVGNGVELLALPFYPSLARPWTALPSFVRSVSRFWRALPGLDCVWLLGPHPLALVFAACAKLHRKRVVLGVRQDLPAYVRSRHPDRPVLKVAAWLLEHSFRLLGRVTGVVAVGPELAANYRHARRTLQLTVSLIRRQDVVAPDTALERSYDGDLTLLAVGRLEEEKNPLLLAEILALLNEEGPRWRLLVCGEGELRDPLAARLGELGQAERVTLLGYVPFGPRLMELYRTSHMLIHTSWTEGMPAVLPEAMAAGLPVVAADVGGVAAAVDRAALVVPPGNAELAADALRSIADDRDLRERLIRAGSDYAATHTLEAETERLAEFLRA